jgi:transcriptional regulator GlxA family with amidase domain
VRSFSARGRNGDAEFADMPCGSPALSFKREGADVGSWSSLALMLPIDKANLAGYGLAEMSKSPRFPPCPARAVEVLTFPAVQLLDVTGPVQVFASANDLVANAGGAPPYRLKLVTQGAQGVASSAGVTLAAGPLSRRGEALDTLLVAGGQGVEAAAANPALVDWLRQRAAQARRVASVCTGAFLLAAAGLLDGRRAVTHWKDCARLAQRFPAVRVEPDPIFVCDGRVWTSAGVSAGIDLALALVEEDLGRSFALAVARYMVVFLKRPGGQAQFSAALALQAADDKFGALHDWINRHLSDDLSLSVLADQAGMSERSFSRHYAEAIGQTPARAVERLRVEAARRLLSESRTPVKRIAQRCGFGSEETMRRSFLRLLAVTPHDYRSRFAS